MSFIKEQQEEARNRMAQQPQRDIDGFAYIRTDNITDELDSLISQVVQNTVEEIEKRMKDYRIDYGGAVEERSARWAEHLVRDRVQSLLKEIASDKSVTPMTDAILEVVDKQTEFDTKDVRFTSNTKEE